MRAEVSGVRLSVLSIVVLGLFAALFARLWFLQVAASPGLEQRVAANRERIVFLPAIRGRIIDAEGRVLADNKPSLSVVVDQNQLRNKSKRLEIFALLGGPLNKTIEQLEAQYQSEAYNRLLPLPVAEDVSEQTGIYLKERVENYPGIDVIEVYNRDYRYAPLAAHIVGYVGRITKEEWPELQLKGYRQADKIGQNGVERTFEDELRGKPGYKRVEVDALNRVLRELERVDPIPGKDVQLTIDLKLQMYAEQVLQIELNKRRTERPPRPVSKTDGQPFGDEKPLFPAPVGSVVVLDPQSGGVMAMASNPTFDPRWYDGNTPPAVLDAMFGYETNPDGTQKLDRGGLAIPRNNGPIFNRAVSGQYAIGSTMKLFTASSGIRYIGLDPDEEWEDVGKWEFPEQFCRRERTGHLRS